MKFENIKVWKRSTKLSIELYKSFACCRDFGFKDQITRAGLSIPCNIAEGSERCGNKDFIRFLQYAKASCGELRTQMYIAINIGYIESTQGKIWIEETREISAMLVGFINSLKRQMSVEQ